jgi:hypothetical protein
MRLGSSGRALVEDKAMSTFEFRGHRDGSCGDGVDRHKDASLTMRLYAHSQDDALKAAVTPRVRVRRASAGRWVIRAGHWLSGRQVGPRRR